MKKILLLVMSLMLTLSFSVAGLQAKVTAKEKIIVVEASDKGKEIDAEVVGQVEEKADEQSGH